MATFFDYEKSYDKDWRDEMMYKTEKLNIPTRFIRYVRHFLSGCKTRVDVNGRKSDSFAWIRDCHKDNQFLRSYS